MMESKDTLPLYVFGAIILFVIVLVIIVRISDYFSAWYYFFKRDRKIKSFRKTLEVGQRYKRKIPYSSELQILSIGKKYVIVQYCYPNGNFKEVMDILFLHDEFVKM